MTTQKVQVQYRLSLEDKRKVQAIREHLAITTGLDVSGNAAVTAAIRYMFDRLPENDAGIAQPANAAEADVWAAREAAYKAFLATRIAQPVEQDKEKPVEDATDGNETWKFADGCVVVVGQALLFGMAKGASEFHTSSNVDYYYLGQGGHGLNAAEVAELYHRTFCPHNKEQAQP